jgi:protein phosphatase
MATLTMKCTLRTDVGQRENNEDSLFGTGRLLAVADGVGGATAGEVASRTVIDQMMSLDKRRLSGPLEDELRQAVESANQTLGFLIACRPQLAGMASTLTAVALDNDGRYLVANVGDSRTYLHRDGSLTALTRDQSLVQMLVEQGAISKEEARSHPQRSVVLRALDGGDSPPPDITLCPARAGDRLLLCSDGLSDVLADDEIAALLELPNRDEAAARLIVGALGHGARDNITVVVADVVETDQPRIGWLAVLPARDGAPPDSAAAEAAG